MTELLLATGGTTAPPLPGSPPAGALLQSAHPRRRPHRRQPLPAAERQPRLLPTDRARRDGTAHGRHAHRPQPRQPPRLAHHTRPTRALAGPSRGAHRRPAPRQGHEDPRPRQTPKRLTGPARTTHPAPRQRQPARKRARDSNTGPTAYELTPRPVLPPPMTPGTTKTPGRMTSGREFRETETDSSGNYPRVAGQRKSFTCADGRELAELAQVVSHKWHG